MQRRLTILEGTGDTLARRILAVWRMKPRSTNIGGICTVEFNTSGVFFVAERGFARVLAPTLDVRTNESP